MALPETESALNIHADGEVVLNVRNSQMFFTDERAKEKRRKRRQAKAVSEIYIIIAGNFATLTLRLIVKKRKECRYCY